MRDGATHHPSYASIPQNFRTDCMKRHLFLMALLAIFTFLPLEAQQKQKWEDQPYKYEVRIGVSPILDTQQYPFNFFGDWSDSALDMMYMEENGSI